MENQRRNQPELEPGRPRDSLVEDAVNHVREIVRIHGDNIEEVACPFGVKLIVTDLFIGHIADPQQSVIISPRHQLFPRLDQCGKLHELGHNLLDIHGATEKDVERFATQLTGVSSLEVGACSFINGFVNTYVHPVSTLRSLRMAVDRNYRREMVDKVIFDDQLHNPWQWSQDNECEAELDY